MPTWEELDAAWNSRPQGGIPRKPLNETAKRRQRLLEESYLVSALESNLSVGPLDILPAPLKKGIEEALPFTKDMRIPLSPEALYRTAQRGKGVSHEEISRRERTLKDELEQKMGAEDSSTPERLITGLAGGMAGGVDPTYVIAPGKNAVTRTLAQGAINAGMDAYNQGTEIERKVRDEYDPQRTLIAGGGGALLQGGQEAVHAIARGAQSPSLKGASGIGGKFGQVTSTLRTPEHNKAVGGVPNSYHVRGQAIDIARKRGVTHKQIEAAYRRAGYNIVESLDEGDHSHFAFSFVKGQKTPEVGPENLGQSRTLQDELPHPDEMARVNNALTPPDFEAKGPGQNAPDMMSPDELAHYVRTGRPPDATASRGAPVLSEDAIRAYWGDEADGLLAQARRNAGGVFQTGRRVFKLWEDPNTTSAPMLERYPEMPFEPEFKQTEVPHDDVIKPAFDPSALDRVPNPLKGIISDAEWDDMPLTERAKYLGEHDNTPRPRADQTPRDTPPGGPKPPPRPGEDPGDYAGKGPKGGDDKPGKLEIYPSEANEYTSRDAVPSTYYDIQFDTPYGKVSADLYVTNGRGEIDIQGFQHPNLPEGARKKYSTVNKLGPKVVRALARELIDRIPELKSFGGFRTSGAREKAGVSRSIDGPRDITISTDNIRNIDRNTPPAAPPAPGEKGFPRPGEPGNRGGPKGGDDTPDEAYLRKAADIEGQKAILDQFIEEFANTGRFPLDTKAINATLTDLKKFGKEAAKRGDTESVKNVSEIIGGLETVKSHLEVMNAPRPEPKAEPTPEPTKAKPEKPAKGTKKQAKEAEKLIKGVRWETETGGDGKGPPEPPHGGDDGDGEDGDGFSKYVKSINTERLDLNQEARAILEEVLSEHGFDHVTFEEMKADAEYLLSSKSIDEILTTSPTLAEAIPHQIAVRTILRDSIMKEIEINQQIRDPARFLSTNPKSREELIALQNLQRVRTAAAADAANQVAGHAGRLLSSFRINIGNDPSRAIQEMLKLNPGRMDPESYAEAFLRMIGNEEGRVKLAKSSLDPLFEDIVGQIRYAMMLSGTGTHVKNTVETFKVLAQSIAENTIGAGLGAFRSGSDRIHPYEPAARLYGLWRAMLNMDTYTNAKDSFIEGTPVNKVSKVEGGEMLLPFPLNLPQRMLSGADSLWRGFIESSDIHGMSVRKALAEGHEGKALWDRAGEIADEAFDRAAQFLKAQKDYSKKLITKKEFDKARNELGEYADIISHSEHHAEVIQMLSEPSAPTRAIERLKTRKADMNMGERMLRIGATMLFPFARVSDRLIFSAVRRSPLAFLDNETVKAFKKGGAEMDEALGRILLGTSILSYYAVQAWNGTRTGDGPADPKKRGALEATGWMPNAKYNPETGTYEDATAFSTQGVPAGEMATLVEKKKAGELDDESYLAEAFGLLKHFLGSYIKNTYMEGGVAATSGLKEGPMADTDWANFVGGMGASFVPAALRQYNAATDPVKRDTTGDRSFGDRVYGRIISGTPLAKSELPVDYDVYGQPVTKDADLATVLTGVGKERQRVSDPTMQEIERLENTQKETLVTPPAKVIRGDRKLNAEEFQQYQKMSGTLFIDTMKDTMMTYDWMDSTDEEKKKTVKATLKAAREDARDFLFPKEEDDWEAQYKEWSGQ